MIITLQAVIFFRQSLLAALDRLLRPYYPHFLTFDRHGIFSDDEESEDQVFAEFHEEKGVVFYPPMYAQRYAAVTDCLMDERWLGKLEKVVDLGFHDMSFIKYLKEVPGVNCILGVDIDNIPLRCASDLLGGDEYSPKRENPLQVTLYQGNAADPDYRLIGCDAVIAIEMIEHMLPHDLERLVHTVFGFIKPWIAVFTTPNSDFNDLFKALESNGFRRLDHFFEWSREQFHDWCSNIVTRYPQYTVNCQGIGPGPPGTIHHGCCSQLALFISKDYHKQQDLNLNSLAVVAKNARQPNDLSELIGNLDDPDCFETDICPPKGVESYTDLVFSDKYSTTSVMLMPSLSVESLEYRDNTSQCNLDTEIGRNFLMFEDDCYCNIVVPRRRIKNRVYEIEDITSRLNCTTLQVKKFSKNTQNLMAKNKIDTLVHTREVVDEIRHLTKMLNFRKDTVDREQKKGYWCNINWGEDAPYWNQYYKIIKEYSYPFETKTEESRILDFISEEINRFIDMQYNEHLSLDVDKVEIPIDHLMNVVQHITADVDRVKDLLEWNGYEVIDDMVIYSRLVVDNFSVSQDNECRDDTISDFDTSNIHSTIASEASNVLLDYYGQCLRRALDVKLRKLRSLLTADEDISTELDKVVCRLMKLALKTSKANQEPPPSRWMQCKLLDLLTLTEKAIERRKRHYIENYAFNALCRGNKDKKPKDLLAIVNTKDDSVSKLVDKYHHVVQSYEHEHFNDDSSNAVYVGPVTDSRLDKILYNEGETKLQRVQAWIDYDAEIVPYPNHDACGINSADIDNSISNISNHRFKKSSRKRKAPEKDKTHRSKHDKYHKIKYDKKTNSSKCKLLKKTSKKKSTNNVLIKSYMSKISLVDCENYIKHNKIEFQDKNHQKRLSNMSKPIPESLMWLYSPGIKNKNNVEQIQCSLTEILKNEDFDIGIENETNIAATQESLLIGLVMDGSEDTTSIRQTVGTDTAKKCNEFEQVTIGNNAISVLKEESLCNMHEVATDNVQSQTIFLYDINEPCTSKGLRHISMDVQCGPDITTSASTRFTKIDSTGIIIGDLFTNIKVHKGTDFGTCTDDCLDYCKTVSSRIRPVGIRIKDSDFEIFEKIECSTMTHSQNNITDNVVYTETQLIKHMSSRLRIDDSCSEFYETVEAYQKNPSQLESSSKNTSDMRIKSLANEEITAEGKSFTKYIRPRLSCGAVHVHSYNEQQASSDVLFQGQWQKYKPTSLAKKIIMYNSGTIKKVIDMPKKTVHSNEKNQEHKIKGEVKLEQKKTTRKLAYNRARNTLDKKNDSSTANKKLSNSLLKSVKFSRNTTKVASKFAISSDTRKNIKPVSYTSRSAAIMSNVAKKECDLENQIDKKYIPKYLKRNKAKLLTNKRVVNQESSKAVIKVYEGKSIEQAGSLQASKTVDVKNEILKFSHEPRDNICFVVFRNDTSNNKNDGELLEGTDGNIKEKDSSSRRTYSPQSQHSSSCSSPNSIATVRPGRSKMISTRRLSTPPNIANIDSNNMVFLRNKTLTKKAKVIKKTYDKDFNNKENIPEPSTKCNVYKTRDKIGIPTLVGAHQNECRVQMTTDSRPLQNTLNSLPGHKSQTPIKTSTKFITDDKRSVNDTLSQARISISPVLSAYNVSSNKTIVLTSEVVSAQEINNKVLISESEHFENFGHYSQIENTSNDAIFTHIKYMIEERFLESIADTPIDSDKVIISREDLRESSIYDSSSPESFKTVLTNEDLNNSVISDIDNAMNGRFDSILIDELVIDDIRTSAIISDIDLHSSITTPTSRMSEYFLADTELNNNEASVESDSSVWDIFERKDHLQIQSNAGTLASQAFSGFSMNLEPVDDDKLDPVNFIDSETGSMALEIARQTASEELYTSGRSSGTFESCFVDEDAMLPYWLFQNNRESVDEEEPEELLHIPVPLPERMYDVNGNAATEVGAGAGAGDGRGMHSDNSQDSSGRGTTTSSSESSSGVQSEAVLIDPSVLTAHFGMIREAINNSDGPPLSTSIALTDTSYNIAEAGEHEEVSTSRSGRRNPVIPLTASDMDADVSSLDTDTLDSSDN